MFPEAQVTLDNIDKKLFRIAVSLEKIAAHMKHVPEAIAGIDLGYEDRKEV